MEYFLFQLSEIRKKLDQSKLTTENRSEEPEYGKVDNWHQIHWLDSPAKDGETQSGAHYRVSSGHWQSEKGTEVDPDAASDQSRNLSGHEVRFALVILRYHDQVSTDCLRSFRSQQQSPECFKHCAQN